MATDLLQAQIKKTGELLTQSVQDAEKLAVNAAEEAKHEAIDAFDAEVAKVEKVVDTSINQVRKNENDTTSGFENFLLFIYSFLDRFVFVIGCHCHRHNDQRSRRIFRSEKRRSRRCCQHDKKTNGRFNARCFDATFGKSQRFIKL